MSILAEVSHATQPIGIRAVISGVEKIGKTTLVSNAPRALLVPLEQGYAGVTVARTPQLADYASVIALLDEIIAQVQASTFPYRSVVFDSATALERLIHDHVLRADAGYAQGNKGALTMESALGGYGRAYAYANELLHNFLQRCDWLATAAAINIVLTCHVFAARIVDPAFGEYDTWDLLLHSPKNQKAYGKREIITQWADLVGFLHEPMYVADAVKGTLRKGISSNKGRLLAVNRAPGYVAGNRYGVVNSIPITAESGWNCLAQEIYSIKGIDFFNRD